MKSRHKRLHVNDIGSGGVVSDDPSVRAGLGDGALVTRPACVRCNDRRPMDGNPVLQTHQLAASGHAVAA